jgi:thiol:disulfide interchange protein
VSAIPKDLRFALCSLRRSSTVNLLLCLCVAASAAQAPVAAASLLHNEAPEFVRTDLKNQKLDLHAYRGKVVLLDFWATWCASCQIEMPRFVACKASTAHVACRSSAFPWTTIRHSRENCTRR